MQIVGDLGHSLSHVVDVGFQAQVLLHFLAKFYNISFCRQNLLDVADTLILNFECLKNSDTHREAAEAFSIL